MVNTRDPRTGVAYLRVSTDEQHLGPEAQRAAIEAWAAREGVEIVAWHEDHASGAAPLDRRPGLMAAVDAVRAHKAAVFVAAKRDRLGRDVVLVALLERLVQRAGAEVVTADGVGAGDGPEAKLMRTMVDAFAAYERAIIGSRTSAALQARKRAGKRAGTCPYGWRPGPDGQTLVPADFEQAALRRMVQLRIEGRSTPQIAAYLDQPPREDRGLPGGTRTCRGARWHRPQVHVLLRRLESDHGTLEAAAAYLDGVHREHHLWPAPT